MWIFCQAALMSAAVSSYEYRAPSNQLVPSVPFASADSRLSSFNPSSDAS